MSEVFNEAVGKAKEVGEELIKLFLRQWIELVVVASSTASGKAKPNGCRGFHPINGVTRVVLVIDRTTFAGSDIAAIKSGGDHLIQRGLRQEIARELFDGELIKWQVLVESLNDPIAIGPDRSLVIEM